MQSKTEAASVTAQNLRFQLYESEPRANVLISTFVHDVTALTVATALQSIGCNAVRWIQPDFTSRQSLSYEISDWVAPALSADGPGIAKCDFRFDAVWLRRSSPPVVSPEVVHRDDLAFAYSEASTFLQSFQAVLDPRTTVINRREARMRADNKLLQLQIAREVGLRIPATLVGNDPGKIKQFIADHKAGVVYKPHSGKNWTEEGKSFAIYTTKVTLADLPSNDLLRAVPGIYQANVPKACEVRSTFFGSAHLSASIVAAEHKAGIDDWRILSSQHQKSAWSAHVLPKGIAARVKRLMDRLGIVFGSTDFIVTPEGEYVFLEINEQGQFLWLEECVPELPMLDTFCRFVVEGEGFQGRKRKWPKLLPDLSLFEGRDIREVIDEDVAAHVVDDRAGYIRMG